MNVCSRLGFQSLPEAGWMPDMVSSSVMSREEFSVCVFRPVTLVGRATEEGAVNEERESGSAGTSKSLLENPRWPRSSCISLTPYCPPPVRRVNPRGGNIGTLDVLEKPFSCRGHQLPLRFRGLGEGSLMWLIPTPECDFMKWGKQQISHPLSEGHHHMRGLG